MVSKKKLQVLPSSWRGKKRYIAFELLGAERVSQSMAESALMDCFLSLFGSEEVARQRLWLVQWNSAKGAGIVRCALRELPKAKAGFLFLQRVGEKGVVPRLVTISGSLKKAKKKTGVSVTR